MTILVPHIRRTAHRAMHADHPRSLRLLPVRRCTTASATGADSKGMQVRRLTASFIDRQRKPLAPGAGQNMHCACV
eukprot:13010292-Alexandrium_andersonii.AAC.1